MHEMDVRLTLSYEEFHRLCEDFVEKSKALGDDWELRGTHSRSAQQPHHYLVKHCTRTLQRTGPSQAEKKEGVAIICDEEEDMLEMAGDTSGLSDQLDMACLDTGDDGHIDTCVHMEYHVVHSVSYQVPILYFDASYSNGRPLLLDDIWRLLAPEFISTATTDKWGLVTQQEHPYLGRPFYHIHPCHTAEVVGRALQCRGGEEGEEGKGGGGSYLVTWLSTFAPVVGLKLPLEYAL